MGRLRNLWVGGIRVVSLEAWGVTSCTGGEGDALGKVGEGDALGTVAITSTGQVKSALQVWGCCADRSSRIALTIRILAVKFHRCHSSSES